MNTLERDLRDLPRRLDALVPPPGLLDAVRARHARRRTARLRAVGVAAAAVVALAVPVAVVTRHAPSGRPPMGAVPTDPRLVPWPTRGDLAGDEAEVAEATHAAERLLHAVDSVHVLWIGHLTGVPGRSVLVQRGLNNGVFVSWLFGTEDEGRVGEYRADLGPAPVRSPDTALIAVAAPTESGKAREIGTVVLALTAPRATTFTWRLQGEPAHLVDAPDGAAGFVVPPSVAPVVDTVVVQVEGNPAEATLTLEGTYFVGSTNDIGWPPRGSLPPLLDAPDTFPVLDKWGAVHGLPGRPGYGNPVWGGRLADGTSAYLVQPWPRRDAVMHSVFGVVRKDGSVVLVRDRENRDPHDVWQVSAYLPLIDGRVELVVVGDPATSAIEYAADGTTFTPLPTKDGVATLVLDGQPNHRARLRVHQVGGATRVEPVDGGP